MTTALALFTGMRSRLSRGWTQTYRARDRKGKWIDPCDPKAVAWSIVGAYDAEGGSSLVQSPEWRLLYRLCGCHPSDWNDAPGRTLKNVIALVDTAIEEVKK